jgi:predicted permease
MTWRPRIFWRRAFDRDLTAEMRAHLEERVEDLVDAGMPRAEAVRRARAEFGNLMRHAEDSREVWTSRTLDRLGGALYHAVRGVRGNFSTFGTALAVLGLATGLFATVFVVADALVFRPARIQDIDRVVVISGLGETIDSGWSTSAWWGQARSVDPLVRWHGGQAQLTARDETRVEDVASVSRGFFEVIRTAPLHGRLLRDEDFHNIEPRAIVISERLWQRRFGGDPDTFGAPVVVGGLRGVVVGILPSTLTYPRDISVWVAAPPDPPRYSSADKAAEDLHDLEAPGGVQHVRRTGGAWLGRLAAGQSAGTVEAEMQALAKRLTETVTPKTGIRYAGSTPVRTLGDALARPVRAATMALFVATAVVLLLALANACTLIVGSVLERRHQFSVRVSLGATRGRLAAALALESLLTGALAGLAGAGVGVVIFQLAEPLLVPLSPLLGQPRVWIELVSVCVLTGAGLGLLAGSSALLVFSTWSDWQLLTHRGHDAGVRRGRRLRTGLVIAQVASAMLLITAAGVAARTFVALAQTPLGFEPTGVLAVRFSMRGSSAVSSAPVEVLLDELIARRLASAATIADRLPLADAGGMRYVGPSNTTPASVMTVGPRFFETLGIAFFGGRDFEQGDENAVIISRRLATALWGTSEAVGQRLEIGSASTREVVGVVDDIRSSLDERAMPWDGSQLYFPWSGPVRTNAAIALKCPQPCDAIMPAVMSEVERLGGDVLWSNTMTSVLGTTLAPARVRLILAGAYGLFGLMLAAAAIYGAVRYVVAERTREATVRMALGASPRAVQRLILVYGLAICFAGIVVGAAFAWPLLSLARSLAFGVTPGDPVAYLGAAAVLIASGVLASVGPAAQLARIDLRALLSE